MARSRQPQREERIGLVVTNLIKLVGAAIALNEVFIEPAIRETALGVAALFVAGGQSLETFFMVFFGSGGKR